MLDRVEWVKEENGTPPTDGTLYATHSGVLEIAGHKLRCFRLSNGQAVFEETDFLAFLNTLFGDETP